MDAAKHNELFNEHLERSRRQRGENIKIFYPVIKAISLTTATIVLLNILLTPGDQSNPHSYPWSENGVVFLTRIVCWCASLAVLMLTYDAAMFSTTFLYGLPSRLETSLFFSFVVFEFSLFAILFPLPFLEKSVTDAILHEAMQDQVWGIYFCKVWLFMNGTYTLAVHLFIGLGIELCRTQLNAMSTSGTVDKAPRRSFRDRLREYWYQVPDKNDARSYREDIQLHRVYRAWEARLFHERKETLFVGLGYITFALIPWPFSTDVEQGIYLVVVSIAFLAVVMAYGRLHQALNGIERLFYSNTENQQDTMPPQTRKPRRLTQPQGMILANLIITLVITAIVTCGILLVHFGWEKTLSLWPGEFLIGCGFSIPTSLLIAPVVIKRIQKIVTKEGSEPKSDPKVQ